MALILICIVLAGGCSQLKQESKDNKPEILVIWSDFDYSHDPLQAKESNHFFLSSLENRTLFKTNSSGKIEGDLAKSYEISKDGKKISISLDENTFSNGTKVSALDVKATLSRIMLVGGDYVNLLTEIKGSSEAKSGSDFFGLSTPDSKTIVINLIEPNPFFIYRLTHPATAIIPASSIGLKGELTSNVHSGNYRAEIISNEINATTVFKPRTKDLPIINVVRKSNEDFMTRPRKEDVDIVLGETKKSINFNLVSIPQLAVASWNIYVKDPDSPFSNIKFRRAILSALDQEESIKAFANRAIKPTKFTADTFDSIDCSNSCKSNLNESKKIIKEIYPNGDTPEITIHIENNLVQQELAILAIERLADIGVKATSTALTPGDLSNEIARGNVQLFRFGWISKVPIGADPLVKSFKIDSTENVSGLVDMKLEGEINQYLADTTEKQKLKSSQDIQKRLQDLWLTRPVAHFQKIITISKEISGYNFDLYGRVNLSKLHK